MSTGASTRSVMRRTASKPSAIRNPLASACCVAAWMTGPSMTGSEYGSPSSSTSTPFSTIATAASTLSSKVGESDGQVPDEGAGCLVVAPRDDRPDRPHSAASWS